MKKWLIFLACITFGVISVFLFYQHKKQTHSLLTKQSVEKHILDNLSAQDISSVYKPALLYSLNANEECVGLGSGITTVVGDKKYVITAAHMFGLNKEPLRWFVRELRKSNSDNSITLLGINQIVSKGTDGSGTIGRDWALCLIGPAEFISPILDKEIGQRESRGVLKMVKNGPFLTSLVTGKKHQIIAVSALEGIAEYAISGSSQPGESGTGFIDHFGSLFVLSGSDTDNDRIVVTGPFGSLVPAND